MSDRKVVDSIQIMSGNYLASKVAIAKCEVDSVDDSTRTAICTFVDGKVQTYFTVELMPVVDDGVYIKPAIGSIVKVVLSDYEKAFVAQYSEIESIVIVSGGSSVEITSDMVKFNDGNNGGMVLLQALVTKLNNLENAYNDFVSKFNSHTHILTLTVGTGTSAPTISPETTVLQPTQAEDIENTKIVQ